MMVAAAILAACHPPIGTREWRYAGARDAEPIRSPFVGYEVGTREFQISLGCVEYEFQVQVMESVLERQVYVCEEWVSDGRGGAVKRATEVLDPEGSEASGDLPGLSDVPFDLRESPGGMRKRPLPLWDHPVRMSFQVSAGFDRVWIEDGDDSSGLVIERRITTLDTESTRRIYLCESELQLLAGVPVDDFEVVLKLELIDPVDESVEAVNIVPLRTRLKRATVLQVLEALGA